MPNTELLTHLAEIAGVFVGFGALISIRSEKTRDDFEIVMIRFIVWFGILVVVTALAPVVISEFGAPGTASGWHRVSCISSSGGAAAGSWTG